jgi:hypothetical protein
MFPKQWAFMAGVSGQGRADEQSGGTRKTAQRYSREAGGTDRSDNKTKGQIMPVSKTSAVERIARALAGHYLSINGEGGGSSVSKEVDDCWEDYRDDAVVVLKSLREPDSRMAAAGDVEVWEAMVLAAIPE